MLGKKYRLDKPVRAVSANSTNRGFVSLDSGAVLEITGLHDHSRVVQVQCENRSLFLFVQDLLERGTEITEPAARKRRAKANNGG